MMLRNQKYARMQAMRMLGVLMLFGLSLLDVAHADIRRVEPGKILRLRPDEGLLVIGVDTSAPLHSAHFRRVESVFDGAALRLLDRGRTGALYVATAGSYRWDDIYLTRAFHYELGDRDDLTFEVMAGAISYGGDLIFRLQRQDRGRMHVTNRGLRALDWLDKEHPGLLAQFEFHVAGEYPDPFPAFYLDARKDRSPASWHRDKSSLVPHPAEASISALDLWRHGHIDKVDINASGDMLAEAVVEGARWGLDLIDLKAGTATRIDNVDVPIARIDWSGDRAIVLSLGNPGMPQAVSIIHIGAPDPVSRLRQFRRIGMPGYGRLLDPLPNDPDHILFTSIDRRGGLMVHRVDINRDDDVHSVDLQARKRINHGVKNDIDWITDGDGNLRAAWVQGEDGARLLHWRDGEFHEVRLPRDEYFDPVALSADGSTLFALTDHGREQRDLVEFDPAQAVIRRTVFSKPGVDVISPLFDARRALIGVTYYDAGRIVSEYFAREDADIAQLLRDAFPGLGVRELDRDTSGDHRILWVDGSDRSPAIFHLDVRARRAELIDEHRPWLVEKKLAQSQRIEIVAEDGLRIEAFLTLPTTADKVPLIVFPHGGPIGVVDTRHFDPQVQFLAAHGFAVLQVNFRGSDGFGRAFRDAGKRSAGTAIEDDIDAAIEHVLTRFPIDAERMCIVGGSYGGYSALMAAIRWPNRFRCAISIAGVTDWALQFTASDTARNKNARALLADYFGDPRTDAAQIMRVSPVYRANELKIPVMLAHGTADDRVEYEHSLRLLRMLNFEGRPPTLLTLEKEGHALIELRSEVLLWNGVVGFLQKHLIESTAEAAEQSSEM